MTEEMRYTIIGESPAQFRRWEGRVPALSIVRAWLRDSLGFERATTADARTAAKLLRKEWKERRNPRNPRVRTRVVRKNSTTLKGYKSVHIQKLPDGRVQVTGRK